MVTGVTRQVIVVKGSAEDVFDQAIFLVRDSILLSGGVSEAELLNSARKIYQKAPPCTRHKFNWTWAILGAAIIAFLCCIIGII